LGVLAIVNLKTPSGYRRGFRFLILLLAVALLLTAAVDALADNDPGPKRNWTVRIGSGTYGFVESPVGYWSTYVGSRVEPGASVILQYAAVVLPTLLLGAASCCLAVTLLRTTGRSRPPNHPAAGKAGMGSRLAIGRRWPGLPEPGRSPFITRCP